MERGIVQAGGDSGGIASLASVIEHHAQALEYDLMTRTGRTLGEYIGMGAAGLVALVSFIRHLLPDSATYREAHPGDALGEWTTTAKTNAILADLFDAYAQAHAKKGRKAKRYPRPGAEAGQKLGSGAIRIRDFDRWWRSG